MEHWRALLSHRPALAVIATALESLQPASAARLRALAKRGAPLRKPAPRRARSTQREAGSPRRGADMVAPRLAALDADGAALKAADAAAREAFAGVPGAARYLARVARARGAQREAKNRFVTANLRLVLSVAHRYERSLLPLADLVQEGNLGLIQAVERFDRSRGVRFSTYAVWWIRHYVNRALSDKGRLVRIPVHTLDALQRVARAQAAIESSTGGVASDAALAGRTGFSLDKLEALREQRALSRPVSIDPVSAEDGERSPHQVIAAPIEVELDDRLDLARFADEVAQLMGALSPIEADVLRLRFGFDGGEGHTLREVGCKYNLSRERIRQLQEMALRKLRGELQRRLGLENARHAA